MEDAHPLLVCVDARIASEEFGGVGPATLGLVSALSRLGDGPERYLILGYREREAWLTAHIGGACTLLWTSLHPSLSPAARARGLLRPVYSRLRRRVRIPSLYRVPTSDGTVEVSGADLVHFTHPSGFLTTVPSIYQPWDLQHRHLPQYFDLEARTARDVEYGALCRQAVMVAVASSATRQDVIEYFDIAPDKVRVVPAAPATERLEPVGEELAEVARRLELPDRFALYPARTWPHKNHLRLVDAVASLAATDLRVDVVCCGRTTDNVDAILARADALGVAERFHFTGFVTSRDLVCLYRLARLLVFPSEFEGWGLPVVEAFAVGLPVACSGIAALEEYGRGGALFFDPHAPDSIADAVRRLWVDDQLRETLAARGSEIAARFTWDRTARIFRAYYRRIAGRSLSEVDRDLVGAPAETRP